MKPALEAESRASALYSLVKNDGEVCHQSRIAIWPKTADAFVGRKACPNVTRRDLCGST